MQAMRILALVMLLLPFNLHADEKLWELLERGGQVVLIRHTITDPGVGDPPGMKLEDCASQRNLSEAGRAHARRIGAEMRKRQIPVGRVLSSPWCRCIETAQLAFGKAEVAEPLSNLFGRPEKREAQVKGMRGLVRAEKANRILVSHGSTISALTGVYLGTGEIVVVTPAGSGEFTVAGRLSLE
jgi:broad specificity phosphatase PhoE